MIERTVTQKGKTTYQAMLYVTSLSAEQASPADLLAHIRGHWTVEATHWVRDVTYGEDASRVRTGNAPRIADLDCGASLGRVIAAIDHANPGLRAACRARQDEADHALLAEEYDEDITEDRSAAHRRLRVPDSTFDRVWPVVVAYTVAMLTQQIERPHRTPWHVLESFELPDWCTAVDSDLDPFHVETLLYNGIIALRDVVDPREPGWDDYR